MSCVDFTHDPATRSWVASANGHPDFPLQNLPLGIFAPRGEKPRGGIAIGDAILDVSAVADRLDGDARQAALLAGQDTLNDLLGAGPEILRALRHAVFRILSDPSQEAAVRPHLYRADACALHLPAKINDYTDFYAGIHHAENVGRQFRPDNPLLPNYKYVPIGYHGRASSIRPSGVDVVRPNGQMKPPHLDAPLFGPSRRLDYELEMAIWVGRGNTLGHPVPIADASDHIAGISILNDWSARDIQGWEYQPLGPFLAKNFHSTLSPWIVTMDALVPYRTAQPPRPAGDPAPLPYLFDEDDQQSGALAIRMDVHIRTPHMRETGAAPHQLSSGSMTAMYWTIAQLITHHASNGCNLSPGDVLGTGTLSGPTPDSRGSLLELSVGGKEPVALPDNEMRSFLEDGDELIITAYAERPGFARIGFGECRAMILPAL
ncbi:fumarylacetoacetase [Sphingobium subterraneum]|uniref:fumarylacetoacetase n=1 Tax=Sphingobium subterraneum TaxID=627688 RepID=A0A841J4D8_9SPHN|nr:fumarylacetoacetase [Sphingobium subterraneum]MBB6123445.1 fumarylacetoacetase [Sphingobium subterraneum]